MNIRETKIDVIQDCYAAIRKHYGNCEFDEFVDHLVNVTAVASASFISGVRRSDRKKAHRQIVDAFDTNIKLNKAQFFNDIN